jgi:hypothetical protein
MDTEEKWICTDPDNEQYCRKISEFIYEYEEKGRQEMIDIRDYRYKTIESIAASYGYILLDNYLLDGYSPENSKMLIAECIFELTWNTLKNIRE